jgi:hypothetical protein
VSLPSVVHTVPASLRENDIITLGLDTPSNHVGSRTKILQIKIDCPAQ